MKKADPLAAVIKKMEDAQCMHPDLQFKRFGYQISCVHCPKRWLAAFGNSDIPDYTYGNPAISDAEYRHSPAAPPRRSKQIS